LSTVAGIHPQSPDEVTILFYMAFLSVRSKTLPEAPWPRQWWPNTT